MLSLHPTDAVTRRHSNGHSCMSPRFLTDCHSAANWTSVDLKPCHNGSLPDGDRSALRKLQRNHDGDLSTRIHSRRLPRLCPIQPIVGSASVRSGALSSSGSSVPQHPDNGGQYEAAHDDAHTECT